MAKISPVPLRLVREDAAQEVPSPPYDALTPAQRRDHLQAHPLSYLAVTRSAEDLPPGIEQSAAEMALDTRAALDHLLSLDVFTEVREPAVYAIRLEQGGHTQMGLVCGVAVDSMATGELRAHEQIHGARRDVLARHLGVVGFQSSPIVLAHRDLPSVKRLLEGVMKRRPLLWFDAVDGLTQTVWELSAQEAMTATVSLQDQPFYVIDGHHRVGAAEDHAANAGLGNADWMLSAVFPAGEMRCEAFYRLVAPVPGRAILLDGFLDRFDGRVVEGLYRPTDDEVALYAAGRSVVFTLPVDPDEAPPVGALASARLQRQVIGPLAGLDGGGAPPRLHYAPAVVSDEELRQRADEEDGVLALLPPVTMEQLFAVADADLTMPAKSTYFVPKARSGVFLHQV